MRAATAGDVEALVAIHERAFAGYFLTLLGARFLRPFYHEFIARPDGELLLCADAAGVPLGFVAGTARPEQFFADVRRARGFELGLAMLPALIRHPLRVAERVIAAVRYRGDRPRQLTGHWLLSSLAVDPAAGGRGAGSALVREFCERARAAGAAGVYLLTDGVDNAAALRFYSRLGFDERESLTRPDGRVLLILARSCST